MVDHLRKLRRKSVDQNKYCWSLSAATLMTASASAAIGSDRVFENECDFELSNSSHRDSITGYGIHNPTPLFPSIQVHSGTTTVSSIIAPPCALWVPMQSTHEPLDRFSTGFSRVFRPRRPRRYCGLCLKRFGCLRNRHSFACQLCDRPVCKRDFVAATQVCVCCSEQLHIMEEERLEAFTSTTSTPKGSTPIPFRSHRRAKSRDGFVPINHTKWGRSRGASDQYFKYSVMDRDTDLESHLSISELVREIDSELQEVGGSIPGDEPFIMTDFLRDTEWGDHVLDVAESVSVFDCNRWSLTSHISHLKAVDALLDVNPASDPIEVFYPLPLDEPDVSNVSPNASSCEEDTCPCFTPFQLSRFPAIRCEDLTQEDEGWSIVMDRGAMSRSLLQKFMLRESFSDAWRKCIHAE
uniref:AlNc14C130G6933 protein n=1 Tax=Albugo laibachii Nc14 TaxID=890382 RepID=F0WK81_9STRA|nr:AlNc14C130G6933 [Albugo laibachii Nc14]|eukprot:CCA21684.1 AlNc14C130G6933 [Albugo laibachii Nc14]